MQTVEHRSLRYLAKAFYANTEAGMGDLPLDYFEANHKTSLSERVETKRAAITETKARGKGFLLGHKEIFSAAALGVGVIGTVFLARKLQRHSISS